MHTKGNGKKRGQGETMNRHYPNDLRSSAPPSEVRVYDLQGNLLRVEPPYPEPRHNKDKQKGIASFPKKRAKHNV